MVEQPSKRAQRIAKAWHRVESWIAVAAMSLIACLLIIDVVIREAVAPLDTALGVGIGVTGIEGAHQIAIFALVVGVFCGIGIATATNTHLVPRVAFSLIPQRWESVISRLADLFTGIFVLFVAWYGFEFVLASKETGIRAPLLEWVVWPVQLAIPIGFFSAAVRYLMYARWPGLKMPPPTVQE